MQIHELDTYIGTPSETDYMAVDDGTETFKIPLPNVGVSTQMTLAEAEEGTETAPRVITPAVFKNSVDSLAETVVETAVSSGSNSNGKWVRFIDGTQICTKSMSFIVSFPNAFGSWYETQNYVSFGDWPVPFINDDIVINATVANRTCVVEALKSYSATSAGNSWLMRPTNVANQDTRINLIAIGRWK